LLSKTKTGTATREEEIRLKALTVKLNRMKEDIEKSSTTATSSVPDNTLDTLRSDSICKAQDLIRTFKTKEINKVIQAVCTAEAVDLAFLIDCTSSMSPYIESVKQNIKTIVKQICQTNNKLNLRLAVVAYRDLCDAQRFEVMDFDSSIVRFENFVGSLKAIGGGDGPEDMAGGIQKANRLSWNNPTRLAFLIADYPCHGTEFHGSSDENYPDGTPGINIVDEIRSLLNNRPENGSMSLHFGRITHCTDKMIDRLLKHYGIEIEVVPVDDTSKMKASITSSVRRSIFKTMTISAGMRRPVTFAPSSDPYTLIESTMEDSPTSTLRNFALVESMPSTHEWKNYPALKVKVFRNATIKSLGALKTPIRFGLLRIGLGAKFKTAKTHHSTMLMRRSQNPFAQGAIRIAFHGQLARAEEELDLSKSSMVMKAFKHIGKGVNDRDQYLKQMEVSNIAHFLAEEYNKSTVRPQQCSTIHFLPVCVVEEEASIREKMGERRFCVEPPLPTGTFQQYSNNTGYWNEDILDETLLRFTMWTYTVTEGYLMITDLQGVKKDNIYYLTDPVVLCKDIIRFGNTNLGEAFMKKCIDSTESHLSEHGWC
jgi:hypothetical protein